MSRLLASLRATVTASVTFLYVLLVATPFVLHARLTHRIGPLYTIAGWGARLALWLAGVKVEVRGGEHLVPSRPCVYMANHQSNVDPPVLFVLLPPRIAIMAKKSLFSVPILGQALRLGSFVPVDRANRKAAPASVDEALKVLQNGLPFLVYPEGTRSTDGRLLRFKHGVFILALRAGVPIIPITVDGATSVMPKGKWQIHPGTVRVTIHPPVETKGRSLEERAALAVQVRSIVASALPANLRELSGEAAQAEPADDSL